MRISARSTTKPVYAEAKTTYSVHRVVVLPEQTCRLFLVFGLYEHEVNDSGGAISVPKELSHREAPFPQYRAEQLGQIQPDVGNVDGHVVCLLQRVCKAEKTTTLLLLV